MKNTTGGKQAQANQFKGQRKLQEGIGKVWRMDENGNPIQQQKPKKKAAVHEVGPTRRANAKKDKSSDEKAVNSDIKLNRQIFSDFSDGESKLTREQLARLLNAVSGVNFQEDEMDYIFFVADRNKDGFIDFSEIPDVQETVSQYLKTRHIIVKIFKKYDVNHDGGLEHDELAKVLTELNDGVKVADDEVEWVMKSSANYDEDKISIQIGELEKAINFWYNYTDDPPDNILLPKDRRKGGVIGRAMTGLHHHDGKHFEDHHNKGGGKGSGKAHSSGQTYVPTSEK